jgi:hypothetical protein
MLVLFSALIVIRSVDGCTASDSTPFVLGMNPPRVKMFPLKVTITLSSLVRPVQVAVPTGAVVPDAKVPDSVIVPEQNFSATPAPVVCHVAVEVPVAVHTCPDVGVPVQVTPFSEVASIVPVPVCPKLPPEPIKRAAPLVPGVMAEKAEPPPVGRVVHAPVPPSMYFPTAAVPLPMKFKGNGLEEL